MKIAIGQFDGVHLGHKKVIEKAFKIITFEPHPNESVSLLTTLKEKRELVRNLEVLKFDNKLKQMPAEEFIKNVIVKKYSPDEIIVGHDFKFGYNREGHVKDLVAFGKKYNFKVTEVPEIKADHHSLRSSSIRKLLSEGNVEHANDLLGRDYKITGKVIHGKGRGLGLGFPTINIKPNNPRKLIPKEGVYRGYALVNNKIFTAAINIGERPTFDEHYIELEAYLIGFQGKVYGKKVTLYFEKFIRNEKKFKNSEELIKQISKDVTQIIK